MSDIDALVAIENAVFEGDRISRKSFRHLVGAPTAAVLVAASAGAPEGYAVVLFRKGSTAARLYSIAAQPRGGGRGRALLAAAEHVALARRRRALRLEVRDDNDRARALYERNGYRRIGELPFYYADGATALRYEKPLEAGPAAAGRPAAGRKESGKHSTR